MSPPSYAQQNKRQNWLCLDIVELGEETRARHTFGLIGTSMNFILWPKPVGRSHIKNLLLPSQIVGFVSLVAMHFTGISQI